MSEISLPEGETLTLGSEGVCRDYLRGACDRPRCRFRHGPAPDPGAMNAAPLNFCHDYQNNSCPRLNCRFIHCTPAEEELYKRTGELPLHLQADAIRKHQLAYGTQPPVCKNFLNGDCRRGLCKYRHITRVEHEAEIRRALKIQGPEERDLFERGDVTEPILAAKIPEPLTRHRIGTFINGANLRRNGTNYNSFGEYGPPDTKRRFYGPNQIEFVENGTFELSECDLDGRTIRMSNFFNGNPQTNQIISRIDPRVLLIEEENNLLHKQIAELKKQVSDLTATNEFLLDQNAQLRVSSKRTTANVTSVTVPAVTITNTTVPPINTSAPPPQQMIRTVTASVATVPVSIATVSAGSHPVSMGAVSMTPQAVPTVSIASTAQQILAPGQQLLTDPAQQLIAQQNLANNLANAPQQLTSLANAPQQLTSSQAQQILQQNLATSQQMALTGTTQITGAINTSQALAMSNATPAMVSYPIMTQSVLQNGMPPH